MMAWFLGIGIILLFTNTLFNIPYQSLLMEMTPDYDERTAITAHKSFFGKVMGLGLGWMSTTTNVLVFSWMFKFSSTMFVALSGPVLVIVGFNVDLGPAQAGHVFPLMIGSCGPATALRSPERNHGISGPPEPDPGCRNVEQWPHYSLAEIAASEGLCPSHLEDLDVGATTGNCFPDGRCKTARIESIYETKRSGTRVRSRSDHPAHAAA
jgi:hypothetical protein